MRILLKAVLPLLASVWALSLGAFGSACKQVTKASSSLPFAGDSLVVDHYVFDAALKRSWAVMIDCRHPNWPAQAVEVPSREAEAASMSAHAIQARSSRLDAAVIASGSRVELWQDGDASIRLTGVALESGKVGQSIRVRAGLGFKFLRGIVRGPHSVELAAIQTGWRQP